MTANCRGVWLKTPPTPPTPPTLISSLYQLNKQVEQAGEYISIKWKFTRIWTLPQGLNANCGQQKRHLISGLHWYASDQYGLLIMVGGVSGVGGDFSQTNCRELRSRLSGVDTP